MSNHQTILLPKLGESIVGATIVQWLKNVGDPVALDEPFVEVATDKATVEYNALDEGWLRQILIHEGQEAAINQPLAILTAEKEESIEGYQIKNAVQPSTEQDHASSPTVQSLEKEKKEPSARDSEEPERYRSGPLSSTKDALEMGH